MAKYNLVHCLLHPTKAHGLLGYSEVIDTIRWGLVQLGHEVRRSVNQSDTECINIIFGAQILPVPVLEGLPANSIIYNFEQMRNVPTELIRPEMHYIAKRFRIWDYSTGNQEAWQRLGAGPNVKIVPIAYAPILSNIVKPEVQDIDVLMYGGADEKRHRAFDLLAEAGLAVVYLCGLYGAARDSLIARSKIILNVNRYDQSRVFEIVRVSYLLANKKAVVSTLDENNVVEDDIKLCVRFTDFDKLASNCRILAENTEARNALENYGFELFSQRDIREILRSALFA